MAFSTSIDARLLVRLRDARCPLPEHRRIPSLACTRRNLQSVPRRVLGATACPIPPLAVVVLLPRRKCSSPLLNPARRLAASIGEVSHHARTHHRIGGVS